MNIKHLFLLSLISLFPLSVLAGGTHDHEHEHEEKPKCTEEHAAMGHCTMDEDHHGAGHGNHAHKSTVGQPADADDATETIHVTALDTMRFEFDNEFEITPGKTITFVVTNTGKVRHEFSIGNEADQISHAEAMMKNPEMVHGDGEAAITLEAGETKSLTWKFDGDEEVVFACTLPGHYQAGMLRKQKIN